MPAVAFPVGTSGDRLPLGAQVIGPPYSDERLLGVVAAYQAAVPPARPSGGGDNAV